MSREKRELRSSPRSSLPALPKLATLPQSSRDPSRISSCFCADGRFLGSMLAILRMLAYWSSLEISTSQRCSSGARSWEHVLRNSTVRVHTMVANSDQMSTLVVCCCL